MALFKKRKKTVVGVDIGFSTVKGIEVSQTGGAITVEHYGSVPIEQSDDSTKRGEAVVKALRKLFSQVKFSTKRVVSSVNGESVIVRVIRMPFFSEKEKEQFDFAVRNEAQDFIPYDISEVAFDYQRLGTIDEGEGKALEVLIVAAQKDLVQWHSEVLKASGLDPRVIDVGSFALVNAVHHGGDLTPEAPVALVDIGSALTNIAIMKGETTRFTRDLSTAGDTISKAIVSELGITPAEAEKAKMEHGISMGEEEDSDEEEVLTISQSNIDEVMGDMETDSDAPPQGDDGRRHQVHAICEQFLGEIVSEIKRCLLFYENQLDGEAVERVYLTGRTIQMKNADRYIGSLLDTPVEVLDPFKNVKGEISSMDPIQRGATYAVCLGLALRGIIGEGVS